MALEGEKIFDEDLDADMEDTLTDTVPPDFLDDETRELAAGLASLDEGELLAALEAMQKKLIGPDGDRVLVAYVLASPHCAEIMGGWERGPAAATAVPVMLLLFYMFRQPLVGKLGGATSGEYKAGLSITAEESHRKVMAVKLRLDKLARSIVRTRLKDIYSHLSSSQKSRQNAALLLLSAIVLRGRALAIEIATSFDFTLEALRKLGHPPKQGSQKTLRVEGHRGILKQPTRVAFLELAMSFLTVGDPGLLRWILQKRPLWIGVLHGISKDDERIIVQVVTLLQEKVMAPAFMVPRGLQSVLFGDATLEQLARISSDNTLGEAGEIAYATLLSLCTNPSHGLCPEESEVMESIPSRSKSGGFGGGQGRLLRLMLRLKVAEVDRHKDVLLATTRARPKLAILYLASFPLSLEPRVSPAWFNAMSLVAQLIPIASQSFSSSFFTTQSLGPPTPDGHLLQSMLLSLMPSSLSRVVLNRGLLHADVMVKQASLRVLLEALLCLRRLVDAIFRARSFEPAEESSDRSGFAETHLRTEGIINCVTQPRPAVEEDLLKQRCIKLSQSILDITRAALPDPNTLLAIFSGLKVPERSSTNIASISAQTQGPSATKKRKRKEIETAPGNQEPKTSISDTYDYDATIRLLWGDEVSDEARLKDGIEGLLYAKVVQVLTAYQMALPVAMADTGFDAFKLLPDDPTSLSVIQQKSLSALLLAATGSSASEEAGWIVGGFAGFGSAYKKFKQLLMFMLVSEVKEVRDTIYEVVRRVMASTGAFESNLLEISMWLDLLLPWKIENPGISRDSKGSKDLVQSHTPLPGSLYASLVDFLSEAVSSIGQSSYKYLDSLHSILSKYVLHENTEVPGLQSGSSRSLSTSEFGPFVVCALEKFVQTVSKSKVPAARPTVALYLVNVLDLLLNYQMNPQTLAMVIVTLMSREREALPPEQMSSPEWTVLLVLFQRAQLLLSNQTENVRALNAASANNLGEGYQAGKLAEVLTAYCGDHNTNADKKFSGFTSAMVRAPDQELVDNFPLLMRFCLEDLQGDFSLLIALLGIREGVLYKVSTAWPGMFTGGLELASSVKYSSEDRLTVTKAQELTMMLGSSSSRAETLGFCVLLLVAPFSVLFSAATFCRQPALLTLPTYTSLLQAGLLRVDHRNWVCMVRLIISGIKHLADSSLEDIGDGEPLHACFSLIGSIMSPVQQSLGGSFLKELTCSSNLIPVYEHVIIDFLNHPVLYNLFLWPNRKLTDPCSNASDLRRDTKNKNICDTSLRRVLASAASSVDPIDFHILSLLTQILEFSGSVVKNAILSSRTQGAVAFRKKILNVCEPYIQRAIGTFRREVDESSIVVASPALFAVSVLVTYTDLSVMPRLLLSLFFLSLLSTKTPKVKSSKQAVSSHVLGLHFVTVFVDSLSGAVSLSKCQWENSRALKGVTDLAGPSIYDLYSLVVDHVTGTPSIMADLCLLSFLQSPTMSQLQLPGFEQYSTCVNSTALACTTPLEVLRHCVCHPNKVTGKIALLLVETSSVHLTEFGRLITVGTAEREPGILNWSTSSGLAEMFLTQNGTNRKVEFVLSDQDLLILLPAARVYVASESRREDAKVNKLANHVASVYAKLLTKQLKKWEKLVSERTSMDGVQDISFLISPLLPYNELYNTLLQYCVCSPLGQVVHMLQSCHVLHSLSAKVRTRLLQSLLPGDHAPLVAQNMWLAAGGDISSCVFEAVAKADLIKHILSSRGTESVSSVEDEGQEMRQQTQSGDSTSQKESSVRQEFLYCLMSTLSMLYKSKAFDGNRVVGTTVTETQSEAGRSHWVQFLEEYLLVQITNLAKELAGDSLDTLEYLPVYRHSMTTLLGFRYGETSAMKACRQLTFVLFHGSQSQLLPTDTSADADVFELFMAHSKFLPSLLIGDSERTHIPYISGKHVGKGTALNSLSSILSLVGSPLLHIFRKGQDPKSVSKKSTPSDTNKVSKNSRDKGKYSGVKRSLDDLNRLEIVKLLRILLGIRVKQSTLGTWDVQSLPLQEVLSILLAAYGGTLSLVDQEIFLLMQEVESHGGPGFGGLSGLDYLWGEAALKRRKAKAEEATLNVYKEPDSIDELRRQTFKEDLLIDPRRCGLAVLFFPLKRKFGAADIGQLGLADQYRRGTEGVLEPSLEINDEELQAAAYDPAFLLPFALHGLSIGCINSEEFVQLGLLAMAFASMSSVDESMRKAGYELLAKYYTVLEAFICSLVHESDISDAKGLLQDFIRSHLDDGPSFKGRLQIRLLMTYVKNAVTEPWQRIPVVLTVFAAEASCILMHPESHQYAIINRFLLRAPSLDLESIPLFQVMFGSGSVQYRSDRLWMLRLLASGLRTSLDARVYRRKFVLELLMSFHDSSMADTFPRKWVLQVLYQAAGVRSFAQYLVEHTGLLSWLSSVAVNDIEGGLGLQDDGGSGQIASMALQVIERSLSWGNLYRHFLSDCLEELSKAGHVFHQLLVRNPTQQYQKLFRTSTLKILLTLVSLSHKRRKHQTHFTLNLGGLVDILQWVGSAVIPAIKSVNLHTEHRTLALQLILNVPPIPVYSYEDKLSLLKVASWSQSVAFELEAENSTGSSSLSSNSNHHLTTIRQVQESFPEKLLRWLAASVVLGELAKEGCDIECGDKFFMKLSGIENLRKIPYSDLDSSTTRLNEKLASLLLALEGSVSRKTKGASLVSVVAALVVLTRRTRSRMPPGDRLFKTRKCAEKTQGKIQCFLNLLLLELPTPEETHLSWQWSFKSPWTARDESVQSAHYNAVQAQYVSEICRTILVLLQHMLLRQNTGFTTQFDFWESSLSLKTQTSHDSDDDPIRKEVGIKLNRLQENLRSAL